MKKFTLLLKTMMVAVFAIYASMNLHAGTITIVPDKVTTGSTSNAYVTTLTNFTAQGIGWAINVWNPNTLQTRGSSTNPQFQFYNTTEIPGSITSVTINTQSNTTIDSGANYLKSASVFLAVGNTVQSGTSTTGLTASTPAGTNSVSWEVTGDNNYFRIQYASGATYNNVFISNIVIEYLEPTNPVVAMPIFSVPTGTYNVPQSVAITTATDGASIYYTTDGNDPTESSTPYTAPITVSTTTTIKAIAIKEGMDNSAIASATYTFLVEDPTFSPDLGFYTAPQDVTISTATGGASIYYTIDGSDPTAGSTPYTAPITVSTTTTIKAIAIKEGMTNSAIVAATYTLPELVGGEGIFYKTGFESSEGFKAGSTYNNANMNFTGSANAQWGTIFGTPTATASYIISGAQSMQMRWYTNTPSTFGSTETRFDLPNVTKVTFNAKDSLMVAGGGSVMDVTVLYSIDEGTTWIGDEVFTLGTTAKNFTYNISATGEYPNVRIKFLITQSGAAPTNTVQVTIDDVAVYVMMTGLVIEPTQTKTASDYVNGGYTDIIIKSDDSSTGQLDLQGEDLPLKGVVKFEKTFTQKEWYAVGFPFDVASVNVNYMGDDYSLLPYDEASESGDFWLKTYDGDENTFNYYDNSVSSATIAQGGYVLEVPSTLVGTPITFTSESGITLTGSTVFPELPSSGYLLTNSPSYAEFDVQSAYPATTGNNYYTYGTYGATNFGLNHNSYTLKPFESLVVENNSTYGLRSTLGAGEVTGLPALNLPDDKVVATEYYNLMGVKVAQPAKGNIYVVKNVFQSGKTSVVKQFINK